MHRHAENLRAGLGGFYKGAHQNCRGRLSPFLGFCTVIETPRRTGTSIGNRVDYQVAIGDYAVHDLFRCGDAGAGFCIVSKVCDTLFVTHERLQMI